MIYGLDIGGTKIEIAIFDDTFTLQKNWRVATPTQDYDAYLKTLVDLINEADDMHKSKGLVGLGMPGIADASGQALCPNIPAASGQNIIADFSKLIDRPITIQNDCRCFALSEANGGAGEGYDTVFGAILGTGAGGGFTIDGKLLKSRQGIAGEYGHRQIPALLQQKYDLPLRACGCGLPSCYEGYISGPGMQFLYRHFGGQDKTAPDIVKAWRQGDVRAIKTLTCYMDILGASMASLVMCYDPDVFVLGGGVSLIDEIVDQLPANINYHLFTNFSSPPVVRAKFGDASGARGAAILAKQMCDG